MGRILGEGGRGVGGVGGMNSLLDDKGEVKEENGERTGVP